MAFEPGRPLHTITASWLNRVDAVVRAADGSRAGIAVGELESQWSHNAVVRVRNDSGGARRQWDVLGIDGPIITAAANLSEFQRVALKGRTPNHNHRGRFVVLLQPLPVGAIGDAIAVGLAPVRILEAEAEAPRVADIAVGVCDYLTPTATGVPVLFAEAPNEQGIRWGVVNLSPGVAAPPPDVNPCCGCPPTRCYDFGGQRPHAFTVDYGDMLCCDGKAGGVHRHYWSGFAWVSPMFWCEASGGTSSECGTAVYRWSEEANPCAGSTATYRWNPGSVFVPGLCLGGTWSLVSGCPDGCSSSPPPPRNPAIQTTCDTVFEDVPCTGDEPPAPGWELLSTTCTCGESVSPPDRDGAYDGEEVTVVCPGSPPDAPSVPCEGDVMAPELWSGDDLQDAKDLGLYATPGTVLWGFVTIHCVAPQYVVMINGCDPLEAANDARPVIDPADLTWSAAPPIQSLPVYIITACSGEPCPPPGRVPARWAIVPPTAYEPARIELRVNGVVRLRYVLPPNRMFCERCLNRFTIDQTGCDWPCENIPENVCARPGDGGVSVSNCLPLASSYALSVPAMTVSNPAWGTIAAGEMALAAGDYVLDLVNNAGTDPRFEENGCRSLSPTCCTWRAPYAGAGTHSHACVVWNTLGWVLQTCDPQQRTGRTARRYQNYNCSEGAEPVLRFGLNLYRSDYIEGFGLVGPSVIEWTGFFGNDWYPGGRAAPEDAGVCGGSECCFPPDAGCGPDGPFVFDPDEVTEGSYYLTWNLHETREDGTLVMRMLDAAYTGWVTAFPQEIELNPQ